MRPSGSSTSAVANAVITYFWDSTTAGVGGFPMAAANMSTTATGGAATSAKAVLASKAGNGCKLTITAITVPMPNMVWDEVNSAKLKTLTW